MKKILILDDELEVDFLFKVMFEDEIEEKKITIKYFSNPHECVQFVMNNSSEAYDYILSDINMPQINGIQFITQLRQNGYQGKVGLMSAYLMDDFKNEMKELNIETFITKPIDFHSLRKLFV